jgi:hypothetical protein
VSPEEGDELAETSEAVGNEVDVALRSRLAVNTVEKLEPAEGDAQEADALRE